MKYDVRFGGETVEDIHGRAHDEADLPLHEIPHLLFVFYNLLVVMRLELIEFVNLSVQHRQCFAEGLQVYYERQRDTCIEQDGETHSDPFASCSPSPSAELSCSSPAELSHMRWSAPKAHE